MDVSAALSTQLSVSTALRFEGPIQKKVAFLISSDGDVRSEKE